ncbi:hypothetical protein ACFQ36_02495 [Arthrobacter sp. GCM10027362]|uniref:hypothetical protein n=1 Tax=Arthrobacter sp. GCM10027362 TaxID=3273379 RepID=UPI0036459BC9
MAAGYVGFIAWLLGRSRPPGSGGSTPAETAGSAGSAPAASGIPVLDTLLKEVEHQEDNLTTSAGNIQQRVILLVGAASIAATLSDANSISIWTVLSIAAAAMAALVGIFAVAWPQKTASANLADIYRDIDKVSDRSLKLGLAHQKITRLMKDRNRMAVRARFVGAGAILLALSVIFLVINVLVTLQAR